MAQGHVQLPADSTGKNLATDIWTNSEPATVHGQSMVLYGPDGTVISRQVVGTKNALDVNIAGSAGGVAQASQVITTATVPGTPNTASTTSSAVQAIGQAGNVTATITGGNFTGKYTFVFEASDDGGTTWVGVVMAREDGALSAPGDVITGSAGAGQTHMWTTALPGFTHFRVRATAVPGTITTGVTVRLSSGPFLFEPNPAAQASPVDGTKRSYTAALDSYTAAAAFADFLEVRNPSAVNLMRITLISLWLLGSTTTAPAMTRIAFTKRSSLNTGGTTTAMAPIPHDSADPAATGTCLAYTAAPGTSGTAVGEVRAYRRYIPASGATADPPAIVERFGDHPAKAIVLRQNESLGLSFEAAPASTVSVAAHVEWTEETV